MKGIRPFWTETYLGRSTRLDGWRCQEKCIGKINLELFNGSILHVICNICKIYIYIQIQAKVCLTF